MTNTQAIKATSTVAKSFLITVAAVIMLIVINPSIHFSSNSVVLDTTGTSMIVDAQGVSVALINQATDTDYQFGLDNGKLYSDTYHF